MFLEHITFVRLEGVKNFLHLDKDVSKITLLCEFQNLDNLACNFEKQINTNQK